MIVLVCLVHVAVWMRPKIIKKRTDKRKSRNITASETNTLIMSSRNNSMNNFGMEELKDVKLKNESPEASIDFTSSYNATSTECIINLDKNSSNKNYRRKSVGSNKSYRKND
ncbi:hypothetical protein BCR32DRAFT_249056 [Anaeromyces robustus]|uniref:Uncharacterized protein n=1 Tax=Anaeromyces robustus TaxID=1754192 RepID=A0A1Y1WS06_9FUNG|nr:hypothetical protein BCR32DRAFT_249056 [Anaeromyces robustus]|eukprot:ORX76048.1 hypothetical protein BCR32DRAFT_249056 [Anaeromyces robustus]